MKRSILIFGLLVTLVGSVHAQRKKDLVSEVSQLKVQIEDLNKQLTESQRTEKASVAKSETLQSRVSELEDENATLMKNLKSFAELSNKNSENVTKVMATLEKRDNQLKSITAALVGNDSTAFVVVSNMKQVFGDNEQPQVQDGVVLVSKSESTFFAPGKAQEVAATADDFLSGISKILKNNPDTQLTVESQGMVGDSQATFAKAAAVAHALQTNYGVDGNRLQALAKEGSGSGIKFYIHPDYQSFYALARSSLKK